MNSSLPRRIINASRARLRDWSHAFTLPSRIPQRVEPSACSRARSLRSPLIDQAVLLVDPHFILEPDLDRGARGYVLSGDCLRPRAGKFF
jgi:hypothetical protein